MVPILKVENIDGEGNVRTTTFVPRPDHGGLWLPISF